MAQLEFSSVSVSRRSPRSFADRDTPGTVVWLRGEHDLSTVAELSDAMTQAVALDDGDLLVDLSGVRFMGAATVGVIVRASEYLRARSRSLLLHAPSPSARRIVDLCGLTNLLDSPDAVGPPTRGQSALGTWVEVPTSDRAEQSTDDRPRAPSPSRDPVVDRT